MSKPNTVSRRMVWGERKISRRFRFLNIALFLLVSAIMVTVMINVLQNVTKQVSVDYVKYFAANTAETLGAHISREIALVSKAVSSHEIINWFDDENNYQKKLIAYDEMMVTINKLYSNNLYAAMQKTLHEYTLDKNSKIDDIKVVATLDPNYFDDAWYFDCISSDMEYVLNVDIDKILHRKLVWLNHKVVRDGIPLGVFCAGLNFSDVVEELFSNYNNSKIRSLIIDANGIIQMDSSLLMDSNFLQYSQNVKIEEVFTDKKFLAAVNAWLNSINGYFEMGIDPKIIELSSFINDNSQYRYATIAPIGSTNWSVITLFDSSSLFNMTKLIPLFILMGVLFIVFAFSTSIMGYQFLYKPAVELARSKDEFLAKMSHEIRTPMNAITGMAELALREDMQQTTHEHILTIKQAGVNLLSIINDILDFSKIESGKLEIVPVKYMLSSLVNDTVNIIRTRLVEKPIRFFTNIDGNIPNNLIGDEVRLRQIILNLLSNAVKYSQKGNIGLTITVFKRKDKQIWLKITVTDTGTGIKPEDQAKLFRDFIQVDRKKNKNIEGTGLGLAITKRLCLAMGGDITISSEYGKGSAFTAYIPQEIESQAPFAVVENPQNKKVLVYEGRLVYAEAICWSLKNMGVPFTMVTNQNDFTSALYREEWTYVFSGYGLYEKIEPLIRQDISIFCGGKKPSLALMVEWGTETFIPGVRFMSIPVQSLSIANILNGQEDNKGYIKTSGVARFCFPSARILVVDDIATNLKVAEGLLAPYRASVDTCLSGFKSIELIKQNEYDIVFMDHMMPEMDGLEATAVIRAWEKEQNFKNSAKDEKEQSRMSFAEDKTQSNNDNSHKRIIIVALTANAVVGMREMFLENGFDDFLSKPIDVSKLDEMLDRWIPEEKKEKWTDSKEQQSHKTGSNSQTGNSNSVIKFPAIAGVDIEKGISMTGGTLNSYKQVLALICKDIDERMLFLLKELKEDTLPTFIIHIHSLKSATASIGASEVSSFAAKLEVAGKEGNIEFIRENIPNFIRQLTILKKDILATLTASM